MLKKIELAKKEFDKYQKAKNDIIHIKEYLKENYSERMNEEYESLKSQLISKDNSKDLKLLESQLAET